MAAPLRIAVLGAPGTGAERLLARWAAQPDRPSGVTLVALPLLADAAQHLATPPPLAPAALAEAAHPLVQAACDAAWLMGLDTAPAASSQADAALRALLDHAGLPFQVLYGADDARIQQARTAVAALRAAVVAPHLIAASAGPDCARSDFSLESNAPARLRCRECGDAVCESRLFHDLLAERNRE